MPEETTLGNLECPEYHEVAFAMSTWRKVKAFHDGVASLAEEMPLIAARTYLAAGARLEEVRAECYDEVRRLQEIRIAGITAELRYAKVQAYLNSKRYPQEAARIVEQHGPDGLEGNDAATAVQAAVQADDEAGDSEERDACLRLLVGDAAVKGEDIRFGFAADVYAMAPSLRIFEQFMWFDTQELA